MLVSYFTSRCRQRASCNRPGILLTNKHDYKQNYIRVVKNTENQISIALVFCVFYYTYIDLFAIVFVCEWSVGLKRSSVGQRMIKHHQKLDD